ncbi:MAG: RNA-directed DNA polymerase [Polaromonas sp.]|uniref:antiviral reverse transcriptase Drt3a n=1 Tax=Polaromonas sp. TaxID=1869339 RepID=UPI0024877E39|nr:antiviral reverse transcriptase Drt3a [Polaromonas sp.]MDI1270618.1 RNA-directed DNA polymerase [Polaromonas sp.]
MYDQSFNRHTLERVLQKGDFRGIAAADHEVFKEARLVDAEAAALLNFGAPLNPLKSFNLKGKAVFALSSLANELVVRKLSANLKRLVKPHGRGRSAIVGNLYLLLEEGVPFRVYRLDIKNFYESFSTSELSSRIDQLAELSPHSKDLLHSLLVSHKGIGGTGVPRGLALSANLADLMMENFDRTIFFDQNVYFYARYVDDIIVVTSCREQVTPFTKLIKAALPAGLELNPNKKTIAHAEKRVAPKEPPVKQPLLHFDYLGYSFSVHEPAKEAKKKEFAHFRAVTVDIADSKVKKIKTRIVRSFLDFNQTSDWSLLYDRIQFLTQNFSVYNSKVGSKKLAGIYYSYPEVSEAAASLIGLDSFLRNAALSRTGKLFSQTSLKLSGKQKRSILSQSFVRGHVSKSFVYFPGQRIKQIQECWVN